MASDSVINQAGVGYLCSFFPMPHFIKYVFTYEEKNHEISKWLTRILILDSSWVVYSL